jgi:hypothetical protein
MDAFCFTSTLVLERILPRNLVFVPRVNLTGELTAQYMLQAEAPLLRTI